MAVDGRADSWPRYGRLVERDQVTDEGALWGMALGRMLGREDRISDLVAFLVALDPQPLLGALGLTAEEPRVSREVMLDGPSADGRPAGRADLLVLDGDRPLALLEVKAAAGQHGDQFNRYDAWARSQHPKVRCHLIGLAGQPEDVPEGWRTDVDLPGLVRAWQDSSHPHAGWLSSCAADVLENWVAQMDGHIGHANASVVADLVARQVASELKAVDRLTDAGLVVSATRTSGGAATVLAWLPFPGNTQPTDAWLCLDLRAGSRADPSKPWSLRLGVEVEADGRGLRQARAQAHDLALGMRHDLTCSALRQALLTAGQDELSAVVRPWRRTFDGLRGDAGEADLAAWRAHVLAHDTHGAHPAFFHDWGRRLASQIEVDVTQLTRHQLRELLITSLDHL
jgi:hypothetical protein